MIFALLVLGFIGNEKAWAVEIFSTSESDILAAQGFMEQGNFSKALDSLIRVVKTDTHPLPEVFMLLATCYQNLKQTDRALEACLQGIEFYPKNEVLEDFYVTLLRNYVPVQQMADKLEQAFGANPQSPILLRGLIMAQMKIDSRNPHVEALVHKLIDLSSDDPNGHYLFGMWAFQNRQDELAIAEWEKTLSLAKVDDKMRVDVNTLIASVESRLNHLKRAEAAFEKAHQANQRLEVHNPAAAFFYLQFLSQNARFEDGQRIIDQILAWAPHFGPAHLEQAVYFNRQHKFEEAIVEANRALDGTGNSPEQVRAIHILLTKTFFSLKRINEARTHQAWLESH